MQDYFFKHKCNNTKPTIELFLNFMKIHALNGCIIAKCTETLKTSFETVFIFCLIMRFFKIDIYNVVQVYEKSYFSAAGVLLYF